MSEDFANPILRKISIISTSRKIRVHGGGVREARPFALRDSSFRRPYGEVVPSADGRRSRRAAAAAVAALAGVKINGRPDIA